MKAFQKTGVGSGRMIRQENSSVIASIGSEKIVSQADYGVIDRGRSAISPHFQLRRSPRRSMGVDARATKPRRHPCVRDEIRDRRATASRKNRTVTIASKPIALPICRMFRTNRLADRAFLYHSWR